MLTPPATSLTPWRPGYWITQTGYDVTVGPTTMRAVPEQLLGVRKP